MLVCDAQTSGGLLIAVAPERIDAFESAMREGGLFYAKIGNINGYAGRLTVVP